MPWRPIDSLRYVREGTRLFGMEWGNGWAPGDDPHEGALDCPCMPLVTSLPGSDDCWVVMIVHHNDDDSLNARADWQLE